ncbi:MAG: hypothetical protein OXC60_17065 [Litoreibacter sp.]|nr:hypothetical protein [Litoreibacter sp.]
MANQDPNLRDSVDHILSLGHDTALSHVVDLIRSRELSRAMAVLNELLLNGTPSEKEEARQAVERLGFISDSA